MNIIYLSAEVEPFAKSGGLGDVLGALPKSLAALGHQVAVVMPKYTRIIPQKYHTEMQFVGYMYVDVAWRHQYCGIFKLDIDGVTYYFLDNEYYFSGELYCFADNERFTFFSKACLDLVGYLGEKVDVIHCNDWSTAIVPVLFDFYYRHNDFYSAIKLVYTIHNLRYQGIMGVREAQDLTALPDYYFYEDKLLMHGAANYMKGGIVFSDAVTTVSPTYAKEIMTPQYGEGMDGLLNFYRNKVVGILNGIDYKVYNPAIDEHIAAQFTAASVKEGKTANKLALQEELGLPRRPEVMLIGLVSRLVDQKGLDIVGSVLQRVLETDVQFVVLGTGEGRYEDMFRYFAGNFPEKMSANITFSNALAHKIYASCDLLLVPSLFEPCGLSQMIALKYGTLPLVRETGGLYDSVTSYNEETGTGNGFSFTHYNDNDLWHTILRAIRIFYDDKKTWDKIVKSALSCDYSWTVSSEQYIELYERLTGKATKKLEAKKAKGKK
jgi:starch synthase